MTAHRGQSILPQIYLRRLFKMKNPSAYLKMRVLGAIESAPGKTQGERVRNVAKMVFVDEEGFQRMYTWTTIYTWLYRYKNHGITGVSGSPRSDKGQSRKITPEELQEAINQVLPHFRKDHYNRTDIYRKAIELGVLRREECAPTTYYRFLREYELLKTETENKRRMAFAMRHANQLWQADTMFGPYVREAGKSPIQSKLIAFIDDASRVICHGEFFFQENIDTMITALRSAMYKRGVPEQLYVDNGAIYTSKELTLICARVGAFLCHTPVRDGASKGKIERFFRTVRETFLARNLDLSSLACLNRQFTSWVEDEYNDREHSAIAMKPIDRFGLDRNRIRYLPNLQANDELFYFEDERTVLMNNTFSFRAMTYEAPAILQGRKIQIRFDRGQKNSPVIVYLKGERIGEAKLVDLIANGQMRNKSQGQNT
jgi:putative transposase